MSKQFLQLTALFLVILIGGGCSSQEDHSKDGYVIYGNIRGLDEGSARLKLRNKTVDSVQIEKGRFKFTGKVKFPEIYYIKINNRKQYITVFLENSEILIDGSVDSLADVSVSGSECHQELDGFYTELRPFNDNMKKLYKAYYKAEMEDDRKKVNEIDKEFEKVWFSQLGFMKRFSFERPESVVAAYVADKHLSNELNYPTLDSLYHNFVPTIQENTYLINLKNRLEILENVAVGKPAKNLAGLDTANQKISLESLKGNIVLVEFWASWCSVCREENRKMIPIYNKYHQRGFEVLGVSLDENRVRWIEAIEQQRLPWPNIADLKGWQSDVRKTYGVTETPHTVLIHRDGTIIAKNIYGYKLEEKLEELL